MPKGKIRYCPICEGDQHVIAESDVAYFLGCGHTLEKPKLEEVGTKKK